MPQRDAGTHDNVKSELHRVKDGEGLCSPADELANTIIRNLVERGLILTRDVPKEQLELIFLQVRLPMDVYLISKP